MPLTQEDILNLTRGQTGPSLNQRLANPGAYYDGTAAMGTQAPGLQMNQGGQGVTNQLIGMQNQFRGANGQVDWQQFYPAAQQWASQNNVDHNLLAQAGQAINPNGGWDANKVQQTMAQFGPKATDFGLPAGINTLNQGAADASQRIGQTQQQVGDLYKQGLQMLQPYQQQGGQANQLQAALSGALGPEAQQQAFQTYQNSPGVEWAQKQGEQSILRNASATGGLGGANVLKALQGYGTGLALQNYNTNFGQIGQVADRGYGAATTGAGLMGQQAGIQAGLGQFNANIPLQQSQQAANMQWQTGRDISTNISNVTSSLADLVNKQGAGMADIVGNTTSNVNTLITNAMNGDADAKQQLATLLGNLGVQAGSQYSSQPIVTPQPSNTLGQLAQVAGGVGAAYQGLTYNNNGLSNYAPNSQYKNYYDGPVGPSGGGYVA